MVSKILKRKNEDLLLVYLLQSQESLLLESFLKKYLSQFVPAKERAFNLNIVEADGKWLAKMKEISETLPVMANYRQIILKCTSIKGDDWREMGEFLPKIPDTTRILILCSGDMDGRLKMVRDIKEAGGFFILSVPKGKELKAMIQRKFDQEEMGISSEAIDLLESNFASDLGRLGQEIDKALLYFSGRDEIGVNDLQEIISQDRILADTAIFELVDHIGRREMREAMRLLQEMLLKGEGELYLLTMIARQFRLILLSKDLAQRGVNLYEIAKELREHPFPIKKSLVQSKNFTFSQLERIICRIYDANLHIITGRFKPSLALEILLFDLKEIG